MKYALIGYLSDIYSGTGKFCLTLQNILKDAGYETVFLSSRQDEALLDYEKQGKVQLVRIPGLKHPAAQYRAICNAISGRNFELAYFNISEAFNCIGVLAAHKCGVKKIIVHSHSSGSDTSNQAVRYAKQTIHSLCRRHIIGRKANVFNACSEKAGQWMFPQNVQDSVHIIHNAVDLRAYRFDPDRREKMIEKLGLENKHTVGFVGGFTYVKNIFFILEFMQKLHAKDEKAVLLMAGAGKLFEEVREYVSVHGMDKYVWLLGQRNDVPDLMQAMDVLVLPSFFEGMPYVAIEAQACGLPVLLSDTITKEACVTDHCYYLPLDDPDQWADLIAKQFALPRNTDSLKNTVYDLETEKDEILKVIANG